jgi:branched-chain amino acid transport system substrate-binding protein
VLAVAASLASASSAMAQIKIGVAGPLTGPNAAFGAQLKNGAEQAAADLNAKGGINGQQIQLVFGDDASDPKQGVSVANKMVGDGVKFIMGHFNSGVTMPASEVYQENGMYMITPSATNPKITERGLWNVSAPAVATISRVKLPASTSSTSSRARRSPSSTTRPPTGRVLPTRPRRP